MHEPLVSVLHGTVHIKTGRNTLDYEFEIDQIKDATDLIRWLRHLAEKSWFTATHTVDFIDAICPILHINRFGI